MNNRLLLIDDELEIRELAADFFSDAGYRIDLATCGNESIAMMKKQDYDVVITDLMMPDGNGEQVVSWVMRNKAYMEVIVMTGYGSVESAVKLMKMGAADYVLKPFMLDELKLVIERCISNL
ncbi:MAG: response regulator, partial [Deltaproteobacteria bacterium]|nr:response regulator [Deltaproteobacteria bacterium]